MANLSISLLGSFQIAVDGVPVKEFKSNRTRALLAFLAVEVDQPHRRESLAGLLWPEWSNREALNNLRSTLSNLRLAIGDRDADPPFLLISRDSIQINRQADVRIDVVEFTRAVETIQAGAPLTAALEAAVSEYRGAFLEGFSINDSPEFEEWALLTRERLARAAVSAWQTFAREFEKKRDFPRAQAYTWRWLELEPLDEAAHSQLMRLQALSGQRTAALAQYESCAGILARELGIQPAEETTRLYEQIRQGKVKGDQPPPPTMSDQPPRLPAFLTEEPPHSEPTLFVAREQELTQLTKYFELALAGHGQVVFVTGEAGSGKTSLIQEFCARAMTAHPELCTASGNCNAYTGIGDPYLPFREILELLTGKVEARLAAGAISREHACRLWHVLPDAMQALGEAGPDLIDTFLLRDALLERASTYSTGAPGWLTRLADFGEKRQNTGMVGAGLQQIDLFEQYTTVLQILARRRPMVLVLDDLQWADLGSISLLFHLGRRLGGARILLLGAFRPEEVAISRDGVRHAIEPVLNEFRRLYGDLEVNLDQAENRQFIDFFLDSEPNHLGPSFRQMLFRQTGGHPLFTVELLRGMQERGDLIKGGDQYWIEGPSLDWNTLPARVEAAIRERIGRLPEVLQRILTVASVEGEVFTAEVVAQVLRENEREVIQHLSADLVRKHRLVIPQSIERLGSKRISHYRFRSYLLQKFLYHSLDEAERAYLHEDVGNAMELLYREQTGEVAVHLARHFRLAQNASKAIQYLHQAGDKAMQLSAYQEAVTHITQALEILMEFPESPERASQELNLRISLANASLKDIPTLAWKGILTKARDLCSQTGNHSQLCLILGDLSVHHYVRAEYSLARELAEEALDLAHQTGNPIDIAHGHWIVGFLSFAEGKFIQAQGHLEHLLSFYQHIHHQSFVAFRGSDSGLSGMVYYACCLWCLGYPDQAENYVRKAFSLARSFNHDFSLVEVLCFGGCMFGALRRDWQAVKQHSEEAIDISNKKGFIGWLGTGLAYHGNAVSMLGSTEEGMAETRESIMFNDGLTLKLFLPGILHLFALANGMSGKLDEGLALLDQALEWIDQTGERFWQAEIYRVKANLHLAKDDQAQAETYLLKALDTARGMEAKSWELRAAMDLARLWQRQGKLVDAYDLLSGIYNWFTEGFSTPDLIEAKSLLAELSSA